MKLALYHPWTYLTGGIERLLSELIARSVHDWTLYTHHFASETTFPILAEQHVVELSPRVSIERSFRPLTHAAATIGRCRLPLDGERALLVSSEGLGDLILNRVEIPAACYSHTPLKILHDPATRARLAERDPSKAAALSLLGAGFSAVDRRLWRRYAHVMANSGETRDRLVTAGLRSPEDIEVLHPGADVDRFTPGAAERRGFLVAGRIMWQKHIELAIDALAEVVAIGVDTELVIAGAVDAKSQPYLAELRERAAGLPVRFVVDPTDDELVRLYRASTALLFTAPNEDFGIVPVEAMACGTPVIAVDAGGPRETVVHGLTGWLTAADSTAFALRMIDVAGAGKRLDPIRRAARRRAEAFGWDRFAARVDVVMEAVGYGFRIDDEIVERAPASVS